MTRISRFDSMVDKLLWKICNTKKNGFIVARKYTGLIRQYAVRRYNKYNSTERV